MTTPEQALKDLRALSKPDKAAEMAAYHKADREYLGVSNPEIDTLYKAWRKDTDIAERVAISAYLWDSNVQEARIAAAKLLTQARIDPDELVWQELLRWVPMFDAWAIADHACGALARRMTAHPERLDLVETWITNDSLWVRRAALVSTLPWTKSNNPKPDELVARDRILGWAGTYVTDPEWFIQKSISWWLRSLSRHDPERVKQFVATYGDHMKPFALKDAIRTISS